MKEARFCKEFIPIWQITRRHIPQLREFHIPRYLWQVQWTVSNLLCSQGTESVTKQTELQYEVRALVFIVFQDVRRSVWGGQQIGGGPAYNRQVPRLCWWQMHAFIKT